MLAPKSPSTTRAFPAESFMPRLFKSCCNVLTHAFLLPDWISGGQTGFGVGVAFGFGVGVCVGLGVGVGLGSGFEVGSGVGVAVT